ncbi:MAG: tetratricopeptide repeat protein, partial [Bacteroidota bacterium]|nr:tetratricopeptide repeat protein [Bacteroidota bacterium]
FGQNIDSLLNIVNKITTDTEKVNFYLKHIVDPLEQNVDYKKMEEYAFKAYTLAQNTNNDEKKVMAGISLSRAYLHNEKNAQSLKLASDLLFLSQKVGFTKGIGLSFRQLARMNLILGDYTKATNYYLEAQKIWEQMDDDNKIAVGFGDLASMNYFIGHFDKAAEYWEKEIEIYSARNDQKSVGTTLSNLALAYIETKNYYKAETSLKKAISLCSKYDLKRSLANAYTNYCKLMYQKNDLTQAIELNNKAIEIYEELKDSSFLSNNYSNGAELFRTQKQYDKALIYINKAFEIENKRNNKTNVSSLLFNRAAIKYDLGNTKDAYDDLEMHMLIDDSLLNQENQHSINELEKKYEVDKKEKENKILNQQLEIGKVEQSRQRLIIALVVVGLGVLAIVAFVLVRQNRIRRKANKELSEKNQIIEEQHKDITDSIKYSKRIQEAIFPPDKMWYSILPDSFVLYKPKDILSGDFYWIEETENFIFLAAADCTGHGVPGALMSIVNFNLLNKAVLEKGIFEPNEILDAVNLWLTQSLHQSFNESSIKDGMDVSLLRIDKKSGEIKYSGAFNPVYVFSGEGFYEIKGDKFPVGAFIEDSIKKFNVYTLTAKKGDIIYLFSDGYADQFGGPKGKKFKYKRMQELMNSMQTQTTETQKKIMETEFLKWKGTNEQVDDVLVIGIRV